jgi:hypothetical protein
VIRQQSNAKQRIVAFVGEYLKIELFSKPVNPTYVPVQFDFCPIRKHPLDGARRRQRKVIDPLPRQHQVSVEPYQSTPLFHVAQPPPTAEL